MCKVFDVVIEDEGHSFIPLVGLLVLRSVLYIEHARYAQGCVRCRRTCDVIDIRLVSSWELNDHPIIVPL